MGSGQTLMPVVGGPKHGAVIVVRTGAAHCRVLLLPPQWGTSARPREEVYDVKKFCAILPGRTDRQVFRVLVYPTVANEEDLTWQTVIDAWADGWSPPPETSEAWAMFSGLVSMFDPNAWRP